jgi:hypothetical protein
LQLEKANIDSAFVQATVDAYDPCEQLMGLSVLWMTNLRFLFKCPRLAKNWPLSESPWLRTIALDLVERAGQIIHRFASDFGVCACYGVLKNQWDAGADAYKNPPPR